MARGPEGKIQDKVIKYARERYGALCKKNEVGRFFVGSGWPDYMVFTKHGSMVFCEFKAPGKAPTPLQENVFENLRDRGWKVHVVSSVEAGKKIIDAECS
jgi:hypothetical protein